MRICVVGDEILVWLFRLAGVTGATPAAASAAAVIDGYLADPGVGVVLVGSSVARAMGAAFRPYLQRRKPPLVLRIPDRGDQTGSADELRDYLQRTLGIRL